MTQEDPFRVGVIVGSGIGSLETLRRNMKRSGKEKWEELIR